MAARSDWHRCKDWTLAERERFDAKIARSRQPWSKWQYFRGQALLLFWHGRSADAKAEAVRLLERSLVEVAGIEDDWAAAVLQDLGEFALHAGDAARAIARFQESVARKPTAERRMRSEHVAEERLAAVLALRPSTPAAAQALFAKAFPGRMGPPSYAELSALPALDVDGLPVGDPDAYAESIVVYHHGAEDGLDQAAVRALFDASPEALDALDALFAKSPPRHAYRSAFLRMYVGQLGAYVGRVLVHSRGGRWEIGTPLMQSRVVIGALRIDPFEMAYRCVFEGASLQGAILALT